MNKNKVISELEDIIEGAGWATDDYIINFIDDLNNKEKYELMLRLASKGLLYNEDDLTEEEAVNDEKPENAKPMTVEDVKSHFGSTAGSSLEEAKNKHNFSTKERTKLANKKEALPDGSFPIRNEQDLKDAIKSYGRAKNPTEAKAWIKKRAKSLGLTSLIPEKWKIEEAIKIVESVTRKKVVLKEYGLPQQVIQDYYRKIKHAEKTGNKKLADTFKSQLKLEFRNKNIDWMTDPYATEILGESKKINLKENFEEKEWYNLQVEDAADVKEANEVIKSNFTPEQYDKTYSDTYKFFNIEDFEEAQNLLDDNGISTVEIIGYSEDDIAPNGEEFNYEQAEINEDRSPSIDTKSLVQKLEYLQREIPSRISTLLKGVQGGNADEDDIESINDIASDFDEVLDKYWA